MPAHKRTPFQIENDRQKVTSLYIRGKTQADIAQEIGVSREQIAYDLKVIQQRWRQDTARDLDADKARELAKIDELERTYWQAWESSLAEKTTTSAKRIGAGADGVVTETTLKRELRDGNPAFLEGVLKCIERRSRLLGLDAPVKTELKGSVEFHRSDIDLSDASDEQLDAIIEQAEAIQEAKRITGGYASG